VEVLQADHKVLVVVVVAVTAALVVAVQALTNMAAAEAVLVHPEAAQAVEAVMVLLSSVT
jgi:hypothetical protein